MTIERALLDELAADAWPPLEQQHVEGWRLRAARSTTGMAVTKRANSALPLDPSRRPLGDVDHFYRARGLASRIQVSDAALDRTLVDLGWVGADDTIVMTGPLSGLPATTGVVVRRTPDDAWLDCWWSVDGRGGNAEKAVAREQLGRIRAPAAYASVRFDGSTMAVARGVAARGWLGVFAVAVLPEHRRSGLGRMVTLALAQWAQGQGASAAYLQVLASNTGARALYSGLGLAPSYCYRYLTNS